MKKRKFAVFGLALLIAVSCFGGYILNDFINSPKVKTGDIDDENIYKPSATDINSVISDTLVKGVTRENKLVTTEVNLSCEILIDESYLNWDILKKRQTLKFYATALYAVNLGDFTGDDIFFEENSPNSEKITIGVYIKKPELLSFGIDPEKTNAGDVERGLLRFGDIKLTPGEFKKIQLRASIKMTGQLDNEEMQKLTEQNAKTSVEEFFKAVLANLNLPEPDAPSGSEYAETYDYEIKAEFKQ